MEKFRNRGLPLCVISNLTEITFKLFENKVTKYQLLIDTFVTYTNGNVAIMTFYI